METFARAYYAAYTALYDHCGEQETDERERYYCILFDESWEEIKDIVKEFSAYRGDLMTSDRACAAFMLALEAVGTPRTPHKAWKAPQATKHPQTDIKRRHGANTKPPTPARRHSEKFVREPGFLPAHCISPEPDRQSYPHRGIS